MKCPLEWRNGFFSVQGVASGNRDGRGWRWRRADDPKGSRRVAKRKKRRVDINDFFRGKKRSICENPLKKLLPGTGGKKKKGNDVKKKLRLHFKRKDSRLCPEHRKGRREREEEKRRVVRSEPAERSATIFTKKEKKNLRSSLCEQGEKSPSGGREREGKSLVSHVREGGLARYHTKNLPGYHVLWGRQTAARPIPGRDVGTKERGADIKDWSKS